MEGSTRYPQRRYKKYQSETFTTNNIILNIPNTWILKKAHNPNKGRELENPIMKVSEVLVNDGLLQTYICIPPEIY